MNHLEAMGRRCQIIPRLLAFGMLMWLGGADPANAQEQSPLAKRLFKEAPQAWEQQMEFFLTLEGSNRGERRIRRDEKWTVQPTRTSIKHWNGNILDEFEDYESGAWKGSVRGENSQYVFRLARDSDTRPWAVAKVDKKVENSLDRWGSRKLLCGDLDVAPRVPILPKLFRSRGFRCLAVEPEQINGAELVRLTFTFAPEGRNRLKGGWLVLDPPHYWVVRRGEVEMDLGEKLEGVAKWIVQSDYKEGSNLHPIPTRRVYKGKVWEKGHLISEQEFLINSYDYRERASIPESEFTLSAYGLPEPHWARPKTRPWYLWLGIAGVACLALGAGAFWLKRRRAAGGL